MPHDPLPRRGARPPLGTADPTPMPPVRYSPTSEAAAYAMADRIAAKVDAGEPVEVEPGGYRALTEAEWARRRVERLNRPALTENDKLYRFLKGLPPYSARPATKSPLRFDDLKPDEWSAGDPDPGFGRAPAIPDSWRWAALAAAVVALAVWRWRHG